MKAGIAVSIFVVAMMLAPPAFAQDAARERCCKQLGGTWRTGNRLGYQSHYYCYGLGGAGGTASNAFYKCVSGGGSSKK